MIVRVDLFRTEYGHAYIEADSIEEAKELVKAGFVDDVQLEDFGYSDGEWEAADDGYQIVDETELDN